MTEAVSYVLEDPRPMPKEAPYTFFLPSQEQLALVEAGDRVYLNFRAVPARTKWESERMWVKVTSTNGPHLTGELQHEPDDIPGLHMGAIVAFERWHILQLDWEVLSSTGRLVADDHREYWERCVVEQAVLDGELKVGIIFRDKPEPQAPDHAYADSGWRIYGDTRGRTLDDVNAAKLAYVALGAVLNKDDSWLHLIDEPIGSSFERDFDLNIYVRESVQ